MKLFGMGRRQRPLTQRIAEAEEAHRLAEIQAKTARAKAELEAFNRIVGQDPEKALLLIRPHKYAKVLAMRERSGSALQEVLEQAQAMRQLQEALAPEQVEPVEVPEDTPGWLAAILNSPLGQGIGAGVGAAIQQAVLQQTQQATTAPTAQQPQVAPPLAPEQLAAPTQQPAGLPPLGRLQCTALLVMLERRSPADMAAQLLKVAGSTPGLVELLNTALALADDEAMAILAELAHEPGWEPVIGWLISHRDYTLELLAELRALVEAGSAG